jgi:hypothetical protein
MHTKLVLIGVVIYGLAIGADGVDKTTRSVEAPDDAKKWEQIEGLRYGVDKRILSHVTAEKSSGAHVLAEAHRRVVRELAEIAGKEKPKYVINDSRTMAMFALGAMAKDSGLEALVPHIEFAPPMTVDENSPLKANPAALALWDAGFASIPPILVYLHRQPRENVSDRAIELYAEIVFGQCERSIGGRTAATQLVQTRMENTDEVYNSNLKRLRDRLKFMETHPHGIAD